jgi:hypothetical protein
VSENVGISMVTKNFDGAEGEFSAWLECQSRFAGRKGQVVGKVVAPASLL